jgi:[acyl-carrier-protein] S-malonyltransferase
MSTDPAGIAALVGDQPVTATEVAAEVARLRAGPLASRLPPDGSPAGRQLRRWTTQRLVLRRLLEQEAAARQLPGPPDAELPRPDRPAAEPRRPGRLTTGPCRPDPALLGSAAADVLATSPTARAVYAAVIATVSVPEAEIRDHYDRNPDRFTTGTRWLVRQITTAGAAVDSTVDDLAGAAPALVDPAVLPEPLRHALACAEPEQIVGPVPSPLGWHLAARHGVRPGGVRPYPEVRDEIAGALLDRHRQQAFARWLDGRRGALVQLHAGYEHPADPHNPDATHRH